MDAEITGYRNLAATILLTALEDVQKGSTSASEFLKGKMAAVLAEGLDLNPDALVAKVDSLRAARRERRRSRGRVRAVAAASHV